jgi:hypothetical protein
MNIENFFEDGFKAEWKWELGLLVSEGRVYSLKKVPTENWARIEETKSSYLATGVPSIVRNNRIPRRYNPVVLVGLVESIAVLPAVILLGYSYYL